MGWRSAPPTESSSKNIKQWYFISNYTFSQTCWVSPTINWLFTKALSYTAKGLGFRLRQIWCKTGNLEIVWLWASYSEFMKLNFVEWWTIVQLLLLCSKLPQSLEKKGNHSFLAHYFVIQEFGKGSRFPRGMPYTCSHMAAEVEGGLSEDSTGLDVQDVPSHGYRLVAQLRTSQRTKTQPLQDHSLGGSDFLIW